MIFENLRFKKMKNGSSTFVWKEMKHVDAKYDDPFYELEDGLILNRTNGNLGFLQMNLLSCSDQEFKHLLANRSDHDLVCADPPWTTNTIKYDSYNLEKDQNILWFFQKRVKQLFTPTQTRKEGFIFLWYLNHKRAFSLRCLYEAGYELIADDSWNKTNMNGEDRVMSRMRGNKHVFDFFKFV